jgi:hypothetical protein
MKINHNLDNHIVLITFNLPQYEKSSSIYEGSPNWMDRRIKLFEKYTLSSFINQTNKNFHLIVLLDPDTPKRYLDIFKSYTEEYSFFNILYTKDFRGEEFENKLLNLYKQIRKNTCDVILSTRCDNDDLIHINYIQEVKEQIENYKVLSIYHGLYWDITNGKFLNSLFPTGPFLTTQSTLDNYLNPRYGNHHDVIKDNDPKYYKPEIPLWVQIIHGENIWNEIHKMPGVECLVDLKQLEEHFGFKN